MFITLANATEVILSNKNLKDISLFSTKEEHLLICKKKDL